MTPAVFETRWDRIVLPALQDHGITVRQKVIGRRTAGAVWLVGVRLPIGHIATVEVLLPEGVKHHTDAALYTVIGTVLSKHGGEI